jgi:hypothetical protein
VFSIPDQIGKAEIIREIDKSEVIVRYLSTGSGLNLSTVKPTIMVSIGATISPASGEAVDFASNGNQYAYTVTAENGEKREWLVKLESYALPPWLNKTWKIGLEAQTKYSAYTVNISNSILVESPAPFDYSVNAPLGELTNHEVTEGFMFYAAAAGYSRPLCFHKYAAFIPTIKLEFDNELTFNSSGFNDEGTALLGTFTYTAGEDQRYTEYPVFSVGGRSYDMGKLFSHIPRGEGSFSLNLDSNTLTFFDSERNQYSSTSTSGTVKNYSGATVNFTSGCIYDDEREKLQLHFTPASQRFTSTTGVTSTKDMLATSLQGIPDYAQLPVLSGATEVWIDFVVKEQ